MIPHVPAYITAIVIATNLAIAGAVWMILHRAARASGLPDPAAQTVSLGSGIFLAAWVGLAVLAAPAPESLAHRDPFYITPLIPLFAILPLGVAFAALGFSPALRRTVGAASLPALVGVQFYRTIGAVFLVLLGLGQVPGHFAVPAAWGDIAVGVIAPILAVLLMRHARGSRMLAISWNVFGLIDLAVAVGMGTGLLATVLSPDGSRVPAAAAMGVFPMIVVPAFAVPVSVLLHIVALGRLTRGVSLGSVPLANPAS